MLKALTPEERIVAVEKAKQARIQKKLDCAHIRTGYADIQHWRDLSSKFGIRLPTAYFPASELKHVKRAAKKTGVDIKDYVESTGCKTLKEFAELNKNWSAQAMVGLFLEYCDELSSNNG
jgi:hypothetical protein